MVRERERELISCMKEPFWWFSRIRFRMCVVVVVLAFVYFGCFGLIVTRKKEKEERGRREEKGF